jgi:hypothetical protein
MPITTCQIDNFCLHHRPVLIFHPTLNCRASDKQRQAVSQCYSIKDLFSGYVLTYKSGFLEGFGSGGHPFWLHIETMTLICRAAYQNTAVVQKEVNKLPPDLDTLFVTYL